MVWDGLKCAKSKMVHLGRPFKDCVAASVDGNGSPRTAAGSETTTSSVTAAKKTSGICAATESSRAKACGVSVPVLKHGRRARVNSDFAATECEILSYLCLSCSPRSRQNQGSVGFGYCYCSSRSPRIHQSQTLSACLCRRALSVEDEESAL